MNIASLILVILSCQGYWFGGVEAQVTLRWVVTQQPTPAIVVWELDADGTSLAHGQIDMPPGANADAVIKVVPPTVRVRTTMNFKWKLLATKDKQLLTSGQNTIEVFPNDLLADLEKRTKGKSIVIMDESPVLSALLTAAKVVHQNATGTEVRSPRPDVIVVGVGRLHDKPFEQASILGYAGAGTSVVFLRQTHAKTVAGYPFEERIVSAVTQPPTAWKYDLTHPLLRSLSQVDLQSIFAQSKTFRAIQLPADEPALEVVFWPREVAGKDPVPIDALLATKAVGDGRVVLCQLPLGPWDSDPRSQLFLTGLIDYLLTRPEPTPRPSDRPVPVQPIPVRTRTIDISSGVAP